MAAFAGDEIFQMAMEMEETGEVFYEALAAATGDQAVADLCRLLAAQEREHYIVFKRLREKLVTRPATRPLTWEEMDFAQTLLNERVVPSPAEAREVAQSGSLTETIDLAIRMEHDAVSFYSDMLRCVDEADAEAVSKILEEEKRHARELKIARGHLH